MSFSVRTERTLPRSLREAADGMDWQDDDPPFDSATRAKARRLGYPLDRPAELYAVEHGAILGRVGLMRIPLRLGGRSLTALGISEVLTAPEAQGRGVATGLMEEAHRRKRSQGVGWSILWTRRSWRAHTLYERLGYRDLFSPPTALRPPPARPTRLPRGYRLRAARASDARRLDALHESATRERLGFLPRRRSFRLRFAMRWRNPVDYRLLSWRGRPVGYLEVTRGRRHVGVTEGIVLGPEHRPALLDAAESLSEDRWVGFARTTLVRDARSELAERGYLLREESYSVCMGRPLATREPVETLIDWARDPRFDCHRGDVF